MDETMLFRYLRDIEGDAFNNECYVLNKMEFLYRLIPESDAKRYADYMAKKCTFEKCTFEYFMRYYGLEITEEDAILLDEEKTQRHLQDYREYLRVIEEKQSAEGKAKQE